MDSATVSAKMLPFRGGEARLDLEGIRTDAASEHRAVTGSSLVETRSGEREA